MTKFDDLSETEQTKFLDNWLGRSPGALMARAVLLGEIESDFMVISEDDTTTASALIELACYDASCAPPPIGTGGSKSDGSAGADPDRDADAHHRCWPWHPRRAG